ncbi:MAG TPA: hypothetical protein VF980_09055, partial [Thermoanaerobaculia bacterium]
GHYDCYLDPTIPTAPYVGTGIYEATVRNVVLQPTTITIVPPSGPVISGTPAPFLIHVTSADGSTPDGLVTVNAIGGGSAEARLRGGQASVYLISRTPGEVAVRAFFTTNGVWQGAVSDLATMNVISVPHRRAVRH